MIKTIGFDKIKNQEDDGYNGIVNAIFQEWVCSSSHKTEMATEKNKSGNIPTDDEHPDCHPHNSRTDWINISQVFRRKEKGIGTKGFHKGAINRTEKNEPEK